jgi:hypothetical protein
MLLIVDTNVPIVANRKSSQASPQCVRACVKKIQEIQTQHTLLFDDCWLILKEYQNKLSSKGQPGVGDAFLKWVLTNQRNPQRCQFFKITPMPEESFEEFPKDASLAGFDVSDRKFVALALAHPDKPPILNAVDSDWRNFETALNQFGVKVEFLCPELTARH